MIIAKFKKRSSSFTHAELQSTSTTDIRSTRNSTRISTRISKELVDSEMESVRDSTSMSKEGEDIEMVDCTANDTIV